MGISINGPSGIDTAYIIDSLVELERTRVTRVETQKSAYQVRIDAYSKLRSLITDIGTKAYGLSTLASFNLYKQTSSNENLVTITGGTGSVAGRYDVGVAQVARSEKMISADGFITSQSATLASLGVTVGTINVGGAEIVIDEDDTVQDLRMKINSATDASGKKIGVSASVLKMTDSNFRLVLTSTATGKAGTAYSDISGDVLQKLGIILTPGGDKGITNQTLTSANNLVLGSGDQVVYSGTDHDGNAVSNTFIMTPTGTMEDFLKQVQETFNGTVTASVVDGKLVIQDKTGGRSQLAINTLDVSGVAQQVDMAVIGDQGTGVLSVGRDAYFSVDGLFMESSSNQATGFISGVTLNLLKSSPGEFVSVEIERDYGALATKVEELLNSFNALVRFAKESQVYGDPTKKGSKKGDLAGDMTLTSMVSQLRTVFQQQFSLLGGAYENLTSLGVKTDTKTGEFVIDKDVITKALLSNFDEVARLFVTTGVASNNSIAYGLSTADTQSGAYVVEEMDSNQRVRIRLQAESVWYESSVRTSDIVTFSDGPAKGLSLTFPPNTLADGESGQFTLSKGLSTLLKEMTDKLTDSREGTITLRQQSWQKSITSADERIARLEVSIEKYRLRLVKQFTAMEQNLSQLQGQSNNMLSSLGSLRSR